MDKGQFFLSSEAMKLTEGTKKNVRLAKQNEKKLWQALARMIIVNKLPFIIMEGQGFQNFVKDIEPRFPMPSRYAMKRDFIRVFVEEKEKLRELLVSIDVRVCFTTNTWILIQNLNYMCITIHFIDSNGPYTKELSLLVKLKIIKGKQLGGNLKNVCWSERSISISPSLSTMPHLMILLSLG